MKKRIAILLAAALMLSLSACGRNAAGDSGACESADEFIQNMGVGWNLGCALSVCFDESPLQNAAIYFLTDNGAYNRSAVSYFDPNTMTAEIVWEIDMTSGTIWCDESAILDRIGIELRNPVLDINDIITYRVDELVYVTETGEVTLPVSEQTTNMSDGDGSNIVATLESIPVGQIKQIRAKITYLDKVYGDYIASGPHKIETMWSNPATTPEMINTVHDRGFDTIRVSVSYLHHMDARGNIDPDWLDRVVEVVDYCMDAEVYCILNISGAGWLTAEPDTYEAQSAVYRRLWEQIATVFAGYGERLLFESFNEILTEDELWSNPPITAFEVVHNLHQDFVDTVRSCGGYNETRNLVLNPYGASGDYAMAKFFELPQDTVKNHLVAQVHCYYPNKFTMNEINVGNIGFVNQWGTEGDRHALEAKFFNMKTRFMDELGIPVIIGEFGVANRAPESERREYLEFYAQTAKKYGIKLVVFDAGSDFTLLDRRNLTWPYQSLVDVLLENS